MSKEEEKKAPESPLFYYVDNVALGTLAIVCTGIAAALAVYHRARR